MKNLKPAIETAGIAMVYCFIILVFVWVVLSGIDKVTERKSKLYVKEKREYYVDIAIDLTEVPDKYLGYVDYGGVKAGDDQ